MIARVKSFFLIVDMRFLVFYGLFFLFPHPLAKDINSIVFLSLTYISVIILFKRFTDLTNFEILFYVLLAIAFSGLHLLHTQEYGPTGLEENMKRVINGPWRYRILVPELMNFCQWLFRVGQMGLRAGFRFFFLSQVFLTSYLMLKNVLKAKREVSFFLPLLYLFMIPFSWFLLYETDFPEIYFSTLLLIAIVSGRRPLIFLSFILGLLNRNSIIFGLFFYFFYTIFSLPLSFADLKKLLIEKRRDFYLMGGLVLSILVFRVVTIWLYGETYFSEDKWLENLRYWQYYWHTFWSGANWVVNCFSVGDRCVSSFPRLLSFAGGIYLLLFLFWKKLDKKFAFSFLGAGIVFGFFFFRYCNLFETRGAFVLLPYFIYALGQMFSGEQRNWQSKDFYRFFCFLVIAVVIVTIPLLAEGILVNYKAARTPVFSQFDFNNGSLIGVRKVLVAGDFTVGLTSRESEPGDCLLVAGAGCGYAAINLPVKSRTEYLLSGDFKTKNLALKDKKVGFGVFYLLEFKYRKYFANDDNSDDTISHQHLGDLQGTTDWHRVEDRFRTGDDTQMVRIAIGFGNQGWGSGEIWADNITLKELK